MFHPLEAAQMFCEIQLGQLLGPNPGDAGKGRRSEESAHAHFLPKERVKDFRRYFGWRDALIEAVRNGALSRRSLLLKVDQWIAGLDDPAEADAFDFCRRRQNLTWRHHAEVAGDWGEKYEQAIEETGIAYDSLRAAKWVSEQFEFVRRTYDGADNDLLRYIISLNAARRHLNESQRAMVAARVATLKDGQRADRVAGSIDLPTAGQLLNVGEASIKRARVVLASNDNELIDVVDSGLCPVSAGAAITGHVRGDAAMTDLVHGRQLDGLMASRGNTYSRAG